MKRFDTDKVQNFEIEHNELLRQLAPECMVLLKSNGDFPVSSINTIALYGNGARQTIKGGTGSGDVNVRHFVSIEEAFSQSGITVTTTDWLDAYNSIRQEAHQQFVQNIKDEAKKQNVPAILFGMGAVMAEPEYTLPLSVNAECAIYVLSRQSGEGNDRRDISGDFQLTQTEIEQITYLNQHYKKFMLVLNVGGVVDLSSISEVDNILLMSQLGTATGLALVDVITGKSYPSGKLTSTWAKYSDYPHIGNFGDPDDTYYKEGVYVGYRYFETTKTNPLFRFGFGLGYSQFEITHEKVRQVGNKIEIEAHVKNIGNFLGKETLQVYVSAPDIKIDKPFQELKAFVKTEELQPGSITSVTATFDIMELASFSESESSFVIEKGNYLIRVGTSSIDTKVCAVLKVENHIIKPILSSLEGTKQFVDWRPEQQYQGNTGASQIVLDEKSLASSNTTVSTIETIELAKDLSDEELVNLCVGHFVENKDSNFIGNASNRVAGAAGETHHQSRSLNIEPLVMADGPAGLRLNTSYVIDENNIIHPVVSPNMNQWMEFADEKILKMFGIDTSGKEIEGQKYYQYCSAIPIGTAVAQSWNLDLVYQLGDLVGREMKIFGVHIWLAPALNIHRNPLCGRNFEYYSEDPLISGKMAAAMTRGVQKHEGCGVSIKHYACNNQETNRFRTNSEVSQRALREIYLRGFEIAVKESQPATVMTSYNLLNGVHTCNRRDLIEDVLREEWGFDGVVMTDWTVTGVGFNKDAKYPQASSVDCVNFGNDLIMPGTINDKTALLNALKEGGDEQLSRINLLRSAERVLRLCQKLER